MIDQELAVVVFESDAKSAERIAAQVAFLGFRTFITTDEQSFRRKIIETPAIAAILAGADRHYSLLSSAVQAIADSSLGCACYLLRESSCEDEVPAALGSRIQGVISPNAGYKDLLATLEVAANFYHQSDVQDGAAHSLLHRNLVGCSADMQGVHHLVKQVADTEASVLVTGESGTGKEVVARCVHGLSSRRDGPFVPINCGAIPAELLESELFGHEKGAFTGAVNARQGRFEIAQGGTLFLDEIGDMPLDMQVKLLRVLQERTFERVGSNKTVRCDVRIVAATHRNLEQLVTEGKFRMDLLYRLNVFPIDITPLRKRPCDIPALVEGYIKRVEREQHTLLRLSDSAMASLSRYYWPGNVRELFNVLERLAILYPQQIVQWSDLPQKYRPNHELFADLSPEIEPGQEPLPVTAAPPGIDLPSEGIDLRPHLAGIERSLMTQALRQSEWVVARAAKLLNLQRTTLVEKMRKFEIQRPEELTEY